MSTEMTKASRNQEAHFGKKEIMAQGSPDGQRRPWVRGAQKMNTIPRMILWVLIGLLLPLQIASAQDHKITPWRHNRAGAVTVGFDDGYLTQINNAVPLLNARGLKATFFIITSDNEGSWDQWRQVAAQGHEIASHTVTHPDLTSLSDSDLRYELSESQRVINQNIPSRRCITLAYPGNVNNPHVQAVTSEYYISGRGGWSWQEGGDLNFYEDPDPSWPLPPNISLGSYKAVNFYNVAGDSAPYAMPLSNLDDKLDTAMTYHAWYDMYFHTIPNEAYYIDYFATLLDHIVVRNIWMATYGEVAQYMRERIASKLSVLGSDSSSILLSLTNSLDGRIYSEPLTIRSIVPSAWLKVSITQGGPSTIVDSAVEGTDTVVYFDAVPNGGTIVLTQGQGEAALSGVSMSPAKVQGGVSSTGTVSLNMPAPVGGAVVGLTSSNTAAAQVPASVTVLAGGTTATFTATTSPVASDAAATITALYNSVSLTATLAVTVTAPVAALSSVSLSPTSVLGGVSSTGTVTLDNPAPAGGALVTLSSSNTAAAQVPASVTVAAGETTATFTITTSPVASNTAVTISALYNGVTRTSTLTVTAPVAALSGVSVSPATVQGGVSSTGTVSLNMPAPVGGAVVGLTSSNTAAAQVPASVTVAAGETTATFTVTTSPVASNTSVTISALYNGVTRTATLTVTTPVAALSSVSLRPTSVLGGVSSTGTVTLDNPAPGGRRAGDAFEQQRGGGTGPGERDGGGWHDDGHLHSNHESRGEQHVGDDLGSL